MIPYLIIFIVLTIIYFGILIAWYFFKKDIFWNKETILLIIIGIVMLSIQIALYIGASYGLFLISIAMQIFYCIVCPFTLKNSLHIKTKQNTYIE